MSEKNDASESRAAGSRKVLTIADVEVAFRWAPPGSFVMGSPVSEAGRWEDETQHEVVLTRGFWLAETPTTQLLWKTATGENPSFFSDENDDWGDDDKRPTWNECQFFPVEEVSDEECAEFAERLNALAIPGAGTFRLPTEAEWEYACRAGTQTAYFWGDALNGDMANCNGTEPCGTPEEGRNLCFPSRVGSYPPNPWGLYDMHGNVWEWTADWFDDYPEGQATDPRGPEDGMDRTLRGGSWNDDARCCRSAARHCYESGDCDDRIGFRLAMDEPE